MNAAVTSTPDTKTYGSIQITASRTVEGGYAINTMTASGGHRYDNLSFTTPDRATYRLGYRIIAEGGLNQVHPDGIHAALVDGLTGELHSMRRRRDTPSVNRVEAINAVLDRLASPAQQVAEAAMLAGIAANIRNCGTVNPLAQLAATGRHRQVRPTMAGAHLVGLSEPLRRIVEAAKASGGTVARSRFANDRQLRALARKGYVTLTFEPGRGARRVVQSATLTERAYAEGWAA